MKTIALLATCLTVAALPICLAATKSGTPPPAVVTGQLSSNNPETRKAAYQEQMLRREETIRQLLAVFEAKDPDSSWIDPESSVGLAIRLLGEMRASEAVPSLLKWAYPPQVSFSVNATSALTVLEGRPPAYLALVRIGKPAEPALLEALKQPLDKPSSAASIRILKEIEGPKCAVIILEDAISKESNVAAKANLQAALKALQ
jgi:hypothetical protein